MSLGTPKNSAIQKLSIIIIIKVHLYPLPHPRSTSTPCHTQGPPLPLCHTQGPSLPLATPKVHLYPLPHPRSTSTPCHTQGPPLPFATPKVHLYPLPHPRSTSTPCHTQGPPLPFATPKVHLYPLPHPRSTSTPLPHPRSISTPCYTQGPPLPLATPKVHLYPLPHPRSTPQRGPAVRSLRRVSDSVSNLIVYTQSTRKFPGKRVTSLIAAFWRKHRTSAVTPVVFSDACSDWIKTSHHLLFQYYYPVMPVLINKCETSLTVPQPGWSGIAGLMFRLSGRDGLSKAIFSKRNILRNSISSAAIPV